jgi:hypothetical protein
MKTIYLCLCLFFFGESSILYAIFRPNTDLKTLKDVGFPAEAVVPLMNLFPIDPPIKMGDFELTEAEDPGCTGTFLNEIAVLTDAHCLQLEQENGGQTIYGIPAITKMVVPEFKFDKQNNGNGSDVAVLFFPPELSAKLKITQFPQLGSVKRAATPLDVFYVGFGATRITAEYIEIANELITEEKLAESKQAFMEEFELEDGRLAWGKDRVTDFADHEGAFISASFSPLVDPMKGPRPTSLSLEGDSGGPLLDEKGKIIGVIQGGFWDRTDEGAYLAKSTSVNLSHPPAKALIDGALKITKEKLSQRSGKFSPPAGWLLGGKYVDEGKKEIWVVPYHDSKKIISIELISDTADRKFKRDYFSKCDADATDKHYLCSADEGDQIIHVTGPSALRIDSKKSSRRFTRN